MSSAVLAGANKVQAFAARYFDRPLLSLAWVTQPDTAAHSEPG